MQFQLSLALVASLGMFACTIGENTDPGSADVGDQEPLSAADDSVDNGAGLSGTFAPGDYAVVCNATALNQRSGASTSNAILKVIPEGSTVKVLSQTGTWAQNEWMGSTGYSSTNYLCHTDGGGTGTTTPTTGGSGLASTAVSRTSFLSIAKASVGFSYFWGGGRLAQGAAPGSCYGSCPSCSHTGSYGADCSGFVAKAWLLPAALPMDKNAHPYSTASFNASSSLWGSTARGTMKGGDALVYRSGSAGHVLMYDKDDPWGSFWSYEARGCSYGIVHNIRTAGSAYKAIKRSGV